MIIYKIQNKVNNKIYIGMTKGNLSRRISDHIRANKSYIQKALNKYGLESFDISVIDHAEIYEILQEKEQYWIKELNSKHPNGYNLTDGGDGGSPCQEVRDKIGKANTGKKRSEEEKRRRSESSRGELNPFYNKQHTKESKAKASKKLKGRVMSEEWIQKNRDANTGEKNHFYGKNHTKEALAKIPLFQKGMIPWNKGLKGVQVSPNKGKTGIFSEETLKRMSDIKKNKVTSQTTKDKIRDSSLGRKDSEETRLKKKESAIKAWEKRRNVE